MAIQIRNTKRIGDVKAFALISVAVICDAFKVLLFFFNAIPVLGTALDVIASFFISVIEIIIDFGALGLSGAYSGQGALPNILLTIMATAVDFTPIIDDLPITTPMVLFIIWNSRRGDTKTNAANAANAAAQQKNEQEEYYVREQAAATAAANADAVRQQAMITSQEALRNTPPAANDNDAEEYQ